MSLKLKRALFVILLISISASIGIVKIYEPISTENLGINALKRITAEAGALITHIYDPYKNKTKIAFLGPALDLRSTAKTEEDLIKLIGKNKNLKDHLKIVKYDSKPIIRSRFEFDYQTFDEPKLRTLREKYKLQDIVKQGKTEFQQILLLRDWVRQRWRIGKPQNVSYNFDALKILERAQKGERFFCSEYATTYIQALSAFGMTARYVGLFKGHIVVEVWSNEFDKWVVMDPYFNLHYERLGIPLNALQLRYAWINDDWKDIEVVKGSFQEPLDDIIDNHKFKLIDYYENFYVRMRNDWFSNIYPRWYPKSNAIMNGLEWSDRNTKNDIRIARETNCKEDLYWPLNHVYAKLMDYNVLGNIIIFKYSLDTLTPNFDKFLIRLDRKEEIDTAQPDFEWKLHKGLNTLEIASLNKFGIKGPATVIVIDYHK